MFRNVNKVKSQINQIVKIDYLTIMSHKHANNLICNEEKMITESLKETINNNKIELLRNNDEIEWLNKMSIDHANCKYN